MTKDTKKLEEKGANKPCASRIFWFTCAGVPWVVADQEHPLSITQTRILRCMYDIGLP